jgi:hypothetical protein
MVRLLDVDVAAGSIPPERPAFTPLPTPTLAKKTESAMAKRGHRSQ